MYLIKNDANERTYIKGPGNDLKIHPQNIPQVEKQWNTAVWVTDRKRPVSKNQFTSYYLESFLRSRLSCLRILFSAEFALNLIQQDKIPTFKQLYIGLSK